MGVASVRFDELTRGELRELAPVSTVVIPLGSTEQHGPHLPVCVDVAIVSDLAERAVRQASSEVSVLLAPTLPFGFAHHHLPFGGTISLSLPVYLNVLTDIGRSLVRGGFRRLLFLNGHGGNDGPVRTVGDRLVFEEGLDVHVAGASYWTLATDGLAELDLGGVPVPGHAGAFETSCLLAVRADLVRRDRFPNREERLQWLATSDIDGVGIRRSGIWEASDGRTDDASSGNGEVGEQALTLIAGRVARFIVAFHQSVAE